MRAAKGEAVGAGDFDGLIRHARSEGAISDGQAQVVTRRRVVKARTPMQSTYIRAIEKHDLVFGLGAGRHRQDLSRRCVCRAVPRARDPWTRIILSRPAVEAGERLGFLPATCAKRSTPICDRSTMRSTMCCRRRRSSATSNGVIEIAPLAFMRGRTLAQFLRHPR